jgi:hypothetical protein
MPDSPSVTVNRQTGVETESREIGDGLNRTGLAGA